MKTFCPILLLAMVSFAVHGGPPVAPEKSAEARKLFEQTLGQYHLPSAEAQGADRQKLLREAATGYERVLKNFSAVSPWGAQALRSLANVRAAQGSITEAVRLHAHLEKKYPREEWEILQSWKSAADLLWENNRRGEARTFYRKIIARFDQPNAAAITRAIVRGSKARLSGA